MLGLEFVQIPQCATPIRDDASHGWPKLSTHISRLPTSPSKPLRPSGSTLPASPSKQHFNFPQLLLSSSLNLSTPPPSRNDTHLLSAREPLSLPTVTTNFRRFVSKSGPVFWLQDRVEEVIMWRKGWKVTCLWMAAYAFLCYFPRILILLPHIVIISVLLYTHKDQHSDNLEHSTSETKGSPSSQQPKEGTADWYANMQAIQNLMGAVSDVYDAALQFLPLFTWATPNTSKLFTLLCLSLLLLVPIVVVLPLRTMFLCAGLFPFVVTHPYSLRALPTLLHPFVRPFETRVQRIIDDDNLVERHWFADMREIVLSENERWNTTAGWSKSNLKPGERKPWIGACDGWKDEIDVEDNVRALYSGYKFVETEDWRVDYGGKPVDDEGWIYSDDSWSDPHDAPKEEWKRKGMTRQRKWRRRIYSGFLHNA